MSSSLVIVALSRVCVAALPKTIWLVGISFF
jgi:hypothetical protein